MMYRLIKWLLHKFNYELVHFAQMKFLNDAVNKCAAISLGEYKLEFIVVGFGCCYEVRTEAGSPVCISVKKFFVEDYGSKEYALACAQELCDKMNETP